MTEDNLTYWNALSQPPSTALKQIKGGRMSGKTDINPQWRYEAMTSTFGVVGIGWKFSIDKMWTEQGAENETFVFVNVSVFVKVDGEWSDAIQGNGGAKLVAKESSKMYNDDDAYKKATTGALGTALKMLGVAADIYAGKFDGSKYSEPNRGVKKETGQTLSQKLVSEAGCENDFSANAIISHFAPMMSQAYSQEAREAWILWCAKVYRNAKGAGNDNQAAFDLADAAYKDATEGKK